MSPSPHIVLACLGTDGDIHPFLGLGRELRARGHEVTLATGERFAGRAASAGLGFCQYVSDAEWNAIVARPEFWHPIRGPHLLARWGVRFLRRQYDALAALVANRPSLLIANPGMLAARLVQETRGVPLVSIVLQPWMIMSGCAPPAMMGGLGLPRWAAPVLGKAYLRAVDGLGGLLLGRELNGLRAALGLKPVRRIFQWWYSPELVLGLFPVGFAELQRDWPPQLKLAGFPRNDVSPKGGVPEGTLEFCRAAGPPVAFTFGTGMMHATELFEQATEACRRLQARAVFLTQFPAQLPRALPPFVHPCEFAPFQELFPLCAAVVHHGGIGTSAKALAAATPQLIVPFAYDQLDNALRVKRLQAGAWLKPRRRNAAAMAAALQHLLEPATKARVQMAASRCAGPCGLERAADLIEAWLAEGLRSAATGRAGRG